MFTCATRPSSPPLSSRPATSAAAKDKALPTRTLGRTGVQTSILALGCGSRLLAYGTQDKGVEAVNLAIDSGIRYLDTAQNYGSGKSETWVGEVMKTRRKEVFLTTKIRVRGYDEAARETQKAAAGEMRAGTARGGLRRAGRRDLPDRGWGGKTGTYQVERGRPVGLSSEQWRHLRTWACGVVRRSGSALNASSAAKSASATSGGG